MRSLVLVVLLLSSALAVPPFLELGQESNPVPVLQSWRRLPDDYALKDGEKIRVVVVWDGSLASSFSSQFESIVYNYWGATSYVSITESGAIIELTASSSPYTVGGTEVMFAQAVTAIGLFAGISNVDVEIYGLGFNWILVVGILAVVCVVGFVFWRRG